jgi:hypothetical protein
MPLIMAVARKELCIYAEPPFGKYVCIIMRVMQKFSIIMQNLCRTYAELMQIHVDHEHIVLQLCQNNTNTNFATLHLRLFDNCFYALSVCVSPISLPRSTRYVLVMFFSSDFFMFILLAPHPQPK